jgi:hypothetical protein
LKRNLPFNISLLAVVAEGNADFLNSLNPNAVISRPLSMVYTRWKRYKRKKNSHDI